jgi:peptide/nickel transport system substrate-binding protein
MEGKKIAIALLLVLFLVTLVPLKTYAQSVPNGPWVDEIDWSAESDQAKVLTMLEGNDIQVYASDINDASVFASIRSSANLKYDMSYGLYFDLTFNPYGTVTEPTFDDGSLNPFCDPQIREAMNLLIDRNYIADELLQGMAKPKLFCLTSAFPEYGKLADILMGLEAEYSYNYEKAKSTIFERMVVLGAVYSEGKWLYKDVPVTIKMIIRIDDPARTKIGNYVADQLESLGFTTERQYKTSREASPIWRAVSVPLSAGAYHIYTGGWITTAVDRDSSSNWGYFYTPRGAGTGPLWLGYHPDPIFQEIAYKLYDANWHTWDERQSLMAQAAELSLKDSVRIWVVDQVIPYAYRKEIQAASDLASGLFANAISSRTIKITGQTGGTVKAACREVLVDPWNMVAGTNWAMDANIILPTVDSEYIMNPYTGLPMANRFVNATVDVLTGAQTISSSSWCTLNFVNSISVPTDAWYDWNSNTQQVITAPEGTTALAKVTINYGDVIGNVKYHDGSVMSLADWLVTWPLDLERNNPDSPLYDESSAPNFEAYKAVFRGWRIVSEHPLVTEIYLDFQSLDAELILSRAATLTGIDSPTWGLGQFWPSMPWQVKAIGIKADEEGLLAFSANKADEKNVEWMSYIGGPSLTILNTVLTEAKNTGYLPFEQFASQYVTAEEATARYTNLQTWYTQHNTFWVANGPFYLDTVDFTGHVAVIKAFRDYTYAADRYATLASPPVPESSVQVPTSVVPGLKANFNLSLSTQGQPYPNDRIDFVKYVIVDSSGATKVSGTATPTTEGTWPISISETTTATFTPGTYTLITIALSKDVGQSGTQRTPFVVIPELSYFQTLLAQTKAETSASVATLESNVNSLSTQISSLQGAISTAQTTMYAAIGLAVIALLIAIYAVAVKK